MYEPSSQKNYNIEPSISTSYEIGTEFRLFNNRLWGDFNYYTRDDKDQIISVTSAPQSGYSTRKMNAGLIRNRGVELSLGGMPVSTKNWKWEMNFNIAKNSNKLVELADGVDSYSIYWTSFTTRLYNYAMVGKFELNDDNTITPLESYVAGWGDSMDQMTNTLLDPATGTLKWTVAYAGQLSFDIIVKQ